MVWFDPANSNKYGDGGVSIIDQWIAGHAQLSGHVMIT